MTARLRTRSGRATPMPPDERRAHIVAAATPLIREHGATATTRQIAAAAGVAEGTLFRVFADKDAIIEAVIAHAIDPWPTVAQVRGVSADLPLEQRLRAAIVILQGRITEVFSIMIAIGRTSPTRLHRHRTPPDSDDPIIVAVGDLLAADIAAFRHDLADVTRRIRLVVFAATNPWITEGSPLTADEVVSLVLDGVRAGNGPHAAPTDPTVPGSH